MKDQSVQVMPLPLRINHTPTHTPIIKRTCSYHAEIPWYELKSPSTQIVGRYHHSSVFIDGKLYVYGGFDYEHRVLSDFHVLDSRKCETTESGETRSWVQINAKAGPGPRHSHSSVYYNGSIFVFGGMIDRFKSTNSIHAYNMRQNKWATIQNHQQDAQNSTKTTKTQKTKKQADIIKSYKMSDKPGPIDSHQAVVVNNQMLIYGGFSNNQFRNEIFAFNLDNHLWRKIYPSPENKIHHQTEQQYNQKVKSKKEPEARGDFSMIVYQQKLLIYAGKNLHTSFNDLWQFDLKTCQFTQIKPQFDQQQENVGTEILNRNGHSAIIYQQYMIIFGGITSVTHERNDLLCYHLQNKTWKVLWRNCEEAEELSRKAETRKTENNRVRILENIQSKDKNQESMIERQRKYRRPIAEEKKRQFVPHQQKTEKERFKKQNQRKFQILQELQNTPTSSNSNNKMSFMNVSSGTTNNLSNILQSNFRERGPQFSQEHSPLLQSLTNSIMLTSHACPGSCSSRQTKQGNSVPLNYGSDLCDGGRKKLKARDGHTAHLDGHEMIIFGGDRHMISFNEVVYVDLRAVLGITESS